MAKVMRYRPVLTGWIGGPGINTWHAEATLDATADNAQPLADAVRAAYQAMRQVYAAGVTINFPGEVTVHDEATGDLVDVHGVTSPDQVTAGGSLGNSTLSRATQALVRLSTNEIRAGKRLAGAHFIGPLVTFYIGTNGQITTEGKGIIQAAYGGLVDVIGPNLVVYGPKRKYRPATEDLPELVALPGKKGRVVSVSVADVPGTLRSRKV